MRQMTKMMIKPELSVAYLQYASLGVVEEDTVTITTDGMGMLRVEVSYINYWGLTEHRFNQLVPLDYYNDKHFISHLISNIRRNSLNVFREETKGGIYISAV